MAGLPTVQGRTLMDDTTWDFFICHANADIGKAEQVYSLLSRTHRAFLASKCIPAGSDWDSFLRTALHNSRVIVPLVSVHTNTAFSQRTEFTRAVRLARDHPARYESYRWIWMVR